MGTAGPFKCQLNGLSRVLGCVVDAWRFVQQQWADEKGEHLGAHWRQRCAAIRRQQACRGAAACVRNAIAVVWQLLIDWPLPLN